MLAQYLCIFLVLGFWGWFYDESALAKENEILILGEEISDENPSSFLSVLPISIDSQSKTIADVLKNQKGLTLRSVGSSGLTTVSIRGIAKADQTLILLDGVRLNSPQGGGVDLSSIPLAIVEKIEIIRGGESALYGTDAIGGVINIVTKKTSPKPSLTYSFHKKPFQTQNISDHKINFTLANPKKDWGLLLSTHSEKDKVDYASKSRGGLVKLNLNPNPKTSFSILQEYYISQKQLSQNALQDDKRLLAHFRGTFDLAEKKLSFQFPIKWTTLKYDNASFHSKHKNTFLEPKIGVSFPLGKKHLLEFLEEFRADLVKSSDFQKSLFRNSLATVLKDDYFLSPAFTLTPVIRLEHAFNFYTAATPKLGILYHHSPWTFKTNISQSFRSPSFNELYWNDSWYKGNPNLKPEKSWDGDLGFMFNKENLKIENSLFSSYLKNLIIDTGYLPASPQNRDQYFLWGNEVSLETLLLKNLLGSLNYTWLNTKLPYRSRHTLNTSLKWKSFMDITLNHQYQDAIFSAWANRSLSSFHLFDLEGSFQLSSYLTLSAKIDNILNVDYERVADYPMPGRTFGVTLSGVL